MCDAGMEFSRPAYIANLKFTDMKTLFVLLLAAGSQVALGQRRNEDQHVPRNVQQNFQKQFPQAADTRWSHSGNDWQADFTDHSPEDRGEMVAHYGRNGRHLDSHIPYDRNDVPSTVTRNVEKRYPHSKDHFYTRIERPGMQPLFQVSMTIGGKHTYRYVDDQGRQRTYNGRH